MTGAVNNVSGHGLPIKPTPKPKDGPRRAEPVEHADPDRGEDTFDRVEHDNDDHRERKRRQHRPKDRDDIAGPDDPPHIDVQG